MSYELAARNNVILEVRQENGKELLSSYRYTELPQSVSEDCSQPSQRVVRK